jgi:hypothetical protein
VDEAKDHLTAMIVQETMVVPQSGAKIADFHDEAFRGLAMVMDVNFNIPDSLSCHLR